MLTKHLLCASFLAALFCLPAIPDNLPPPEYQKLTHDIYKQLIEINTSYSTGATTPAAQAVAERLKAAGFPDSDIQVLGAALSRHRPAQAPAAARPSGCRGGQAFRLVHGSFSAHRKGRLLLWAWNHRRQSASRHLDRESDPL